MALATDNRAQCFRSDAVLHLAMPSADLQPSSTELLWVIEEPAPSASLSAVLA